jgi:hypothetical protein
MAMQKAVRRVFIREIREIREIRGSIPFGCGFAALGHLCLLAAYLQSPNRLQSCRFYDFCVPTVAFFALQYVRIAPFREDFYRGWRGWRG